MGGGGGDDNSFEGMGVASYTLHFPLPSKAQGGPKLCRLLLELNLFKLHGENGYFLLLVKGKTRAKIS